MPANRHRRPSQREKGQTGTQALFAAQALPGLVPFLAAELTGAEFSIQNLTEDEVIFTFSGKPERLGRLKRCIAVYRVVRFDVPRPKALTGHAHLTRLLELISQVRQGQEFRGFRFGAAGSDSPTFNRLAQEIASATGLQHDPEEGELLLRVRPGGTRGWEVLARLTPRPISARGWRECNLPGGLNATVAVAAHDLIGAGPADRYLNLMCGSGTLLIERALAGDWRQGIGIDIDEVAIDCCRSNCIAAGVAGRVQLGIGDATDLDLEDASIDRITADLPWGDAVGSHAANASLYPAFLAETARVSSRRAKMAVITHELRIFERALAEQNTWRQREVRRIVHGGHRPGMYILERSR